LTENEQYYSKQIDTITKSLPPDVLLSGIRFDVQNAEIKGLSPSERSIQQLVVNISDKDTYDSVGLVEINSTEEDPNLFEFTISSKYAGETKEAN
jgi:Tfp pilus assembly protein PilN